MTAPRPISALLASAFGSARARQGPHTSIAEQTKRLALNATIEAATASQEFRASAQEIAQNAGEAARAGASATRPRAHRWRPF